MQQSSVYTDSLRLEELCPPAGGWHLYGSSRIGIYQTNKAMAQRTVRIENGVGLHGSASQRQSRFYSESGAKNHELPKHLGNVLTVVTDKKLPVCSGTSVSYFIADIVSATDYSPFGAPLAERTWQGSEYRYGFNTQERDDEIAGVGNIMTAEFWEYDTRLGRRWNLDPIVKPWESRYAVLSNNPIVYLDPMGLSSQDGNKPPNRPNYAKDNDGNILKDKSGAPLLESCSEAIITAKHWKKVGQVLGKVWDGVKAVGRNALTFVIAAFNSHLTNQIGGYGRMNPSDFGDESLAAKGGQRLGDMFSIMTGGLEAGTGFILGGGGVTISLSGVGTIVGAPAAAIGGVMTGHGLLVIHTAWDAMTKVEDVADNANNNKENCGSSDDGSADMDGVTQPKFEKMGKQKGSSAEKMPDDVARLLKIKDIKKFKKYLHQVKKQEGRGGADNYNWDELIEIGKEFKQLNK